MKGFAVFCVVLMLAPATVFAGDEPIVAEEVVVTATRVERPIETIPASVTVITREEIEKTQAKTVDDLLRREVGVTVASFGGIGYPPSIRMRGLGTARMLILKDGIPLNSKLFGVVRSPLSAMSVQNIERIEIVRGTASTLYGSRAMGGVINIITRQAEPGFSGDVSLEGGSMDTAIGSLGLRYGAENFALRFAFEHKETGGYEYRPDWDPDNHGWVLPEAELGHISLGGDLWLGESLLRVGWDNFREEASLGTTSKWSPDIEINNYRVSWETPLWGFGEETLFSIRGYYLDERQISTSYRLNRETRKFDIFRSITERSVSEYGIMSQISTVLGNHHLVAGIDLGRASIDQHARTLRAGVMEDRKFEGAQNLSAVFVNNEMHLGERVILSAGLRYDHWENKGGRFYDRILGKWKEFPTVTESAISPRGGIVYKLAEDIRLRASVGTGFRAPSLWHMFNSGPGVRRYWLGNPELKPERLDWSYDIGVDMQPHENLALSLTFYQSRLGDFLGRIDLDPGDPRIPDWVDSGGLPVRRMINVGAVDIHGVEAGLDFRLNEKWSAFVNHTFNVSKVREHKIDPAVVGNYLHGTPRHVSVIGFTYDNPRLFTLSLDVINKGSHFRRLDNEQKVPGYQLVNMRVSREIFEDMKAFINVENLTDEKWFSHYNALGPPFNAMVGMRYTF